MKITLEILNPDLEKIKDKDVDYATWYSRRKIYETESNWLDEDIDIVNSPIGHKLDNICLDDVRISSKQQIDDLIKLLENAKECFKQ